jgi:hypothetical protein
MGQISINRTRKLSWGPFLHRNFDYYDSLPPSFCVLRGAGLAQAATSSSALVQRADSSVILDRASAEFDGDQLLWSFELRHPGTSVVQLVAPPAAARGESSAAVETGTTKLSGVLNKGYIIEDDLVS